MDVSTQISIKRNSSHDQRFAEMFASAAIGIAICDLQGRIQVANPTLARMLGSHAEEIPGLNLWGLSIAESPATDQKFGPDSLDGLVLGEHDHLTIDHQFQQKGGPEFWGRLTVSLARDLHHQPLFIVALLEDASDRKRTEDELRQAEKMEVIGRLAGGIAHDFNNLLTGILLYCDLLLAELNPEDRLRRYVKEVRNAGEQGSALTHQLLALARKQASEPRATFLNEVVASMENLLRRLIGEQIELVLVLDPAAGPIFADPGQLRQLLLNLVLNARDAIATPEMAQGKAGQIRICTGNVDFAEPNGRKCVYLVVEDNGCGMNAETRSRLFEPFFTTKKLGEGTGMGLATVEHIVRGADGHIEVASEPRCGTRIEILLPRIALESRTGCGPSVANISQAKPTTNLKGES